MICFPPNFHVNQKPAQGGDITTTPDMQPTKVGSYSGINQGDDGNESNTTSPPLVSSSAFWRVSQTPPPQSSLWFCAWCSLEEGSWITLRILLKSYLGLCLNRKWGGHSAKPRRSIRLHSHNQQPQLLRRKKMGGTPDSLQHFWQRGSAQE